MSTTENGTKLRYDTLLNQIRKEATKIREANDKLQTLSGQLETSNHPAPAQRVRETATTVFVGLEHLKEVCWKF